MICAPVDAKAARKRLADLRYKIALFENRTVQTKADKRAMRHLDEQYSELLVYMRKQGWVDDRQPERSAAE